VDAGLQLAGDAASDHGKISGPLWGWSRFGGLQAILVGFVISAGHLEQHGLADAVLDRRE
jgi:hypothetical protein